MQEVREKANVFELSYYEQRRAFPMLKDWFRFKYGTEVWFYWQIKNFETIAFYWRFDKWGA